VVVNVIFTGFNSGWRKVVGLSSRYNELTGKEFDKNQLINFNGNGKYYAPVFTWADTVAPTAIAFINSTIFGEEYENDLLVGSVKQERIIIDIEINPFDGKIYVVDGSQKIGKIHQIFHKGLKPVKKTHVLKTLQVYQSIKEKRVEKNKRICNFYFNIFNYLIM